MDKKEWSNYEIADLSQSEESAINEAEQIVKNKTGEDIVMIACKKR